MSEERCEFTDACRCTSCLNECDVTILYCQGCGACKPDDGSTCPPNCRVQLFPRTEGKP